MNLVPQPSQNLASVILRTVAQFDDHFVKTHTVLFTLLECFSPADQGFSSIASS